MKIVVNRCWGGFRIPDEVAKKLGCDIFAYETSNMRNDPELVKAVEEWLKNNEQNRNNSTFLQVVEIPDKSTDFYVSDYDGMETVIYVVDGLIYFA